MIIYSNIQGTTGSRFYFADSQRYIELDSNQKVEFQSSGVSRVFGYNASSSRYSLIHDNSAYFGNVLFNDLGNTITVSLGNANINFSYPSAGQALVYDGTAWVPQTISSSSSSSLLYMEVTLDSSNYTTTSSGREVIIVSGVNPSQTLRVYSIEVEFSAGSPVIMDAFLRYEVSPSVFSYSGGVFGFIDPSLSVNYPLAAAPVSIYSYYSMARSITNTQPGNADFVLYVDGTSTSISQHILRMSYEIV